MIVEDKLDTLPRQIIEGLLLPDLSLAMCPERLQEHPIKVDVVPQQPVLGQDAHLGAPVGDGPPTDDDNGVVSGQMVDESAHALHDSVVGDLPEEAAPVLFKQEGLVADAGDMAARLSQASSSWWGLSDVMHSRSTICHRAVEVHNGNGPRGLTTNGMSIFRGPTGIPVAVALVPV